MTRLYRIAVALALVLTLTLGAVATAAAGGHDNRRGHFFRFFNPPVFSSPMAALLTPGQVIDGVTGAGAPWSIDRGKARLFENGWLFVRVKGLIVTARGDNPAATGKAVVSCNGVVAATTEAVPFSPEGDATVFTKVVLPSPCFGPSVFFTSATGSWFAVTGF